MSETIYTKKWTDSRELLTLLREYCNLLGTLCIRISTDEIAAIPYLFPYYYEPRFCDSLPFFR